MAPTLRSRIDHFIFCGKTHVKPLYINAMHSLVDLLRLVDKHPALYTNKSVLSDAIRRYEKVWIPMLLSLPDKNHRLRLVPPLDVHWVWVCHMLAPLPYARDLAAVASHNGFEVRPDAVALDHQLTGGSQRLAGMREARELWEQRYPHERFTLSSEELKAMPMMAPANAEASFHEPSKIAYDLIAAASRQMFFHYQVGLTPQYADPIFLHKALKRYLHRFLYLKKLSPETTIVPTYDIDLAWHSHMLYPASYRHDTHKICGQVLAHDDSMNDRTEGSDLSRAWNETKELWMSTFGSFGPGIAGGMWRGNVTAEERSLRPRIANEIADVVRMFEGMSFDAKYPGGRKGFQIALSFESQDSASQTSEPCEWVHKLDSNLIESNAPCIERVTDLIPHSASDNTPKLQCRVTHRVRGVNNTNPFRKIESVIEIRASSMHAAKELPLATAHTIDHQQLVAKFNQLSTGGDTRSVLGPNEKALLLRIAGEDAAILIGSWASFSAPVPGKTGVEGGRLGVRGQPGREGHLELRLGLLNSGINHINQPVVWQSGVRRDNSNPPSFNFSLANGMGSEATGSRTSVCVKLESGRIECPRGDEVLPTYLLGMAVSVIYVMLQPRYRPDTPGSDNSMYPPWATAQRGLAMVEGAGGEMESKHYSDSYGHIAEHCEQSQAYVGVTSSFIPAQVWKNGRSVNGIFIPGHIEDSDTGEIAGCGGCGGVAWGGFVDRVGCDNGGCMCAGVGGFGGCGCGCG